MVNAREVSDVSRRLKKQIDTLTTPTVRKKSNLDTLASVLKCPYSSYITSYMCLPAPPYMTAHICRVGQATARSYELSEGVESNDECQVEYRRGPRSLQNQAHHFLQRISCKSCAFVMREKGEVSYHTWHYEGIVPTNSQAPGKPSNTKSQSRNCNHHCH